MQIRTRWQFILSKLYINAKLQNEEENNYIDWQNTWCDMGVGKPHNIHLNQRGKPSTTCKVDMLKSNITINLTTYI